MKFKQLRGVRVMVAASLFVAVLAIGLVLAGHTAYAGTPYVVGDVFAGVGGGQINEYTPAGVFVQTLDTTSGSVEEIGMCFADATNLYTANFTAGTMTKFDNAGNVVTHPWGGPFSVHPESCIVDASGNIFTGEVDGANNIRKFNPAGTQLAFWAPTIGSRGADWIDLSADQCTILYTSEDSIVRSYNTCTSTQNPDFASGLAAPCYALRIRSNGDVMVTCESTVYRLNSSGAVLQTYTPTPSSLLFAMNLDPDGTSFWTADYFTGRIWHIDIATGAGTAAPVFTAPPNVRTTAGLAIYGEPTVGGGGGGGTGFMTGGGYFLAAGKKITHGFELHCDTATAPNNLEVNLGKGNKFHLENLISATCSDDTSITPDPPAASFNTYSGSGTGRYNGVAGATATWTFTDAGEPGRNDEVTITIVDAGGNTVLNVGPVTLGGGNYQAHN
jgi:hypothetical protein